MTADEWNRIRPLLESALDLEGPDRAAFLDTACTDPVLRREVESLLGFEKQARLFMENPLLDEPCLTNGQAISLEQALAECNVDAPWTQADAATWWKMISGSKEHLEPEPV